MAGLGHDGVGLRPLDHERQRHRAPQLVSNTSSSSSTHKKKKRIAPAPGAPSTPPFIADYQAYDFPPGMIQRIGSIRFTADDLAHALFTTGRAPGNQFSYGKLSVWEFIHRASVIPAYIRRDRNQHLVRSRLARELDRSEKVALSYALGQAITGHLLQRHPVYPVLAHIDRYAERYSLTFSSQKRPDLIGYSSSQGWSVAEAKGRSGAMEFGLRRTGRSEKIRPLLSKARHLPWH